MSSYLDNRLRRMDAEPTPVHRVLVIGADRVLGGAILRELSARGIEARALRRWSAAPPAVDLPGVEWVVGDLDDEASLDRAVARCDAIVLAAVEGPGESDAVRRARGVLALARRSEIKRLVAVSSAVLGEDGRPEPAQGVARAGYMVDLELRRAAGVGMPLVLVHPGVCLGPGGGGGALEPLLKGWATGAIKAVPRGRVNVVDARDAAWGSVEALIRGREGARYVLGGHGITSWALAESIGRASGSGRPWGRVPDPLLGRIGRLAQMASRPSMAVLEAAGRLRQARWLDSARAEGELGVTWRPLEETVQEAVAGWRLSQQRAIS